MIVRAMTAKDVAAAQTIADATQLFPGEMLPDMAAGFLGTDVPTDLWLVSELKEEVVGFCYAVPEQMTEGTWNMLALAVLPALQDQGFGGALVSELEHHLKTEGQRILIVDTSSTAAFDLARRFYRKQGYAEEARIREFWGAGDDKVIFWKSLT